MAIEYTTERGVTIQLVPIPFLLDRIREVAKENEPAKPTYIEHLAGGAEQEREITHEMATAWSKENPEGWAEHAEAWMAYLVEWTKWDGEVDDRIWNAICLESIQVELPENDEWADRQKRYYGLEPPDDPAERRRHYVQTEVMGGPKDYVKATTIANGGEIGEDALAIAEASFRGFLQGQIDSELQNLEQSGPLDDESADDRDENSEAMGQDPDRVLGAE